MKVGKAMNKNVKTVRPDSTVLEASELMNEFRIGSLVVVSGPGAVVGIITERDIMKNVVAKSIKSSEIKVEDVMSKKMVVIDPDATLEDAADAMNQYKVKKLPVVKDGALVGIITATDLITYEEHLIEKVSELLKKGRQKSGIAG